MTDRMATELTVSPEMIHAGRLAIGGEMLAWEDATKKKRTTLFARRL